MGLEAIAIGVTEEIAKLKLQIKKRPSKGAGRAKDEAAHRVAMEAAKLYAKVTGSKPTYSEGPSGVSGKYTPFLRDVYDAFGWTERSLRTGAEAAISALEPSDFEYARIGLLSPFLSFKGK